jgi:UDP-GlcNAc:undecaprenyl-phosphate/decaprenyl-phosphate GlcNAc-1-phosphate transferase
LTYLLLAVFALCLMILLMPLVERLSLHIGAVDQPNARKVHELPIPRLGGVLITFTFLLTTILFLPLNDHVRGILAGSLMIAALGLTDDLIGLQPRVKFAVQWLVAVVFIWIAQPDLTLPFLGSNPWLTWPIGSFFIVALINAVNLQDGLDGLASGLVIIAGLCMGIYLTHSGEWITVKVLVALIASVLGFLRVNTWPARIFMGDAGSYLLGFVLGAVFLLGTGEGHLPWWTGLFFFAIPLFDTTQVFARRLLAGISPFKADRTHLHHLLLDNEYTHGEVVYSEYMIASLLAMVPLLLISPLILRWVGFGLVALLLVAFLLQSGRKKSRRLSRQASNGTNHTHQMGSLHRPMQQGDQLKRGTWLRWLTIVVYLSGFGSLLGIELASVSPVSFKYALLPASLAIAYAAWSWYRTRKQESLRLSISMTLIVAVQTFIFHQFEFASSQYEWGTLQWHMIIWFGLALYSVGLFVFRFRYLSIIETPIEYFLIFGAVILFFLPVELKGSFSTDLLASEILCFFVVYRIGVHTFAIDEAWIPVLGSTSLITLIFWMSF